MLVFRLVGLALLGGGLTGCFLWTTRGEGDQLMEDGAQRQQRLEALESGVAEEREALTSQVERAKTQVAELEVVLKQATQVVTRNSADLGLEVRRLREQLQTLEGQLAELRDRHRRWQEEATAARAQTKQQLQLLSQKLGLDVSLSPDEIPADADALFAAAESALSSEAYSRARALFLAFVDRHGEDPRVDDAVYQAGMTYLAQERPATALGQFRTILSDHANGDQVEHALLAMAEAFYQLNACSDAQDALNALIRGHRRSSLVPDARRKLRAIERAPSGYCRD